MSTAAVTRIEPRAMREKVSATEWAARVDLAAAYRLVDHFGWTTMVYNHISARVPDEEGAFLINPFGLAYREVTASNLVKIDIKGRKLDDSPYSINEAGFTIHSAIHAARPDVGAVAHTHTEAGTALSCLECGLLPLNQDSLIFYDRIGYHDFEGIALDLDERERLVQDLGPHYAMIMRSHGLLTCGRTVAEAMVLLYMLERAARAQLQATATGAKLNRVAPQICEKTARQFGINNGSRCGDNEWPAWVRLADSLDPSYRT